MKAMDFCRFKLICALFEHASLPAFFIMPDGTLRINGKLREKLRAKHVLIQSSPDGRIVLIGAADGAAPEACRVSWDGKARAGALAEILRASGVALPARYIAEWDEAASLWQCERGAASPARARPAKALSALGGAKADDERSPADGLLLEETFLLGRSGFLQRAAVPQRLSTGAEAPEGSAQARRTWLKGRRDADSRGVRYSRETHAAKKGVPGTGGLPAGKAPLDMLLAGKKRIIREFPAARDDGAESAQLSMLFDELAKTLQNACAVCREQPFVSLPAAREGIG